MSFLFPNKPKASHGSAVDKRLAFLDPEALVVNDAVAGKLQHFARLPPQSDVNEWLATNCLAFFHQINTQVGVIAELCTTQGCPSMSAGKEIFEWLEDRKGNKKHKTPAKQYINTALEQIQKILQDEEQFPTKFGLDFPPDIVQTIKKIFRTYFAILAHIYYHHFTELLKLGAHRGLNTLLLHLVYFIREFGLMDPKELQCLEELVTKLIKVEEESAKNPKQDDDYLEYEMHTTSGLTAS